MKKIILDNNVSVFLAKLGLFRLLSKYIGFVTTKQVVEEIKEGVKLAYRDARIRLDLIKQKKITIMNVKLTEIIKNFKLRETDESLIALAYIKKYLLATEDKQLRNICKILQIPNATTLSLIEFLRKKKEVNKKQVEVFLDLLLKWGYNENSIIDYRITLNSKK